MKTRHRRACIDIETFPILGHTWGPKWEANLLDVVQRIRLASFAWKWFGEPTTHCLALPDMPGYEKNKESDRELVQELWKVFDEADILVAHNGKAFDFKQSNAFFVQNDIKPPSPYVVIDTKTEAKRYFKFPSNSLDDLGQYLGVGRKERTGGMDLWWDCMDGKPDAWRRMKRYNKQDVVLLEKVYEKIMPWMNTHPNLNVYEDRIKCCKICLGSRLQSRGSQIRRNGRVIRYVCQDCGAWNQGAYTKSDTLIR